LGDPCTNSQLSLSLFTVTGKLLLFFCLELWTPKLGAPRFAHAAHPLLRHWHWYWRQNNTFIQNTKKRKKTCPSEDKHRTIQNHGLAAFYTVSQKKLGHFSFYCNFVKCWPILIIFLHRNQKLFVDKTRVIFSTDFNFVAALPCKTNTSMNMNVTTALFYSAIEYLNKA